MFKKINYGKLIEMQAKQGSTKLYPNDKKNKPQTKVKQLRYNRTQGK